MFAPPECHVLEIFQPTYVLASIYKIATCLGQSYGYLVGRRGEGPAHTSANLADIVVHPGRFSQAITMMMAATVERHGTSHAIEPSKDKTS